MSEPPSVYHPARPLAILEERMEARQAKYETGLERLEREIAERNDEMAKREIRLLFAVGGLMSLGVVILGVLVHWPA